MRKSLNIIAIVCSSLTIVGCILMLAFTGPALAKFKDPIVLNEIRGESIFVCKTLGYAIEEIIDEIHAVKNNLTPTQYWALLKPMIDDAKCISIAIQYRPLEVLCKWTGASYYGPESLVIQTMRLFSIEVISRSDSNTKPSMTPTIPILYMITDKDGPDPVKNSCEKIK